MRQLLESGQVEPSQPFQWICPALRAWLQPMPGILRRETSAVLDLSNFTLSAPLGQPFDHLRPDLALGLGTDGQPDVAG